MTDSTTKYTGSVYRLTIGHKVSFMEYIKMALSDFRKVKDPIILIEEFELETSSEWDAKKKSIDYLKKYKPFLSTKSTTIYFIEYEYYDNMKKSKACSTIGLHPRYEEEEILTALSLLALFENRGGAANIYCSRKAIHFWREYGDDLSEFNQAIEDHILISKPFSIKEIKEEMASDLLNVLISHYSIMYSRSIYYRILVHEIQNEKRKQIPRKIKSELLYVIKKVIKDYYSFDYQDAFSDKDWERLSFQVANKFIEEVKIHGEELFTDRILTVNNKT